MRLRTLPIASAAAVIGAAALLAACGDSNDSGSGSNSTAASGYSRPATTDTATTDSTTSASTTAATGGSSGGGSTLTLSADPNGKLSFDKSKLAAKSGTVTVTMDNPSSSGIPHAIAVEGNGVDKDGETVQPGGTSTVTAQLKPGTYTFYCPVPGHEQAGMKGTLTVG